MHDAPGSPHAPTPAGVQTPPTQHPFGQLVASQTHAPLAHRRPAPHGALAPHRQAPELEHVSVFTGSHATQAAPFLPHAIGPGAVQVAPEQQPAGHVVLLHPLHTPAEHWPPAQLWHCAPPAPQLPDAVPDRQVPSAAQQPAQLVVSQTQLPPPSAVPAHRWPAAHAGPAPHRHAPFAHAFAAVALQATHALPAVPQLA